jgi:hypothetical protein
MSVAQLTTSNVSGRVVIGLLGDNSLITGLFLIIVYFLRQAIQATHAALSPPAASRLGTLPSTVLGD